MVFGTGGGGMLSFCHSLPRLPLDFVMRCTVVYAVDGEISVLVLAGQPSQYLPLYRLCPFLTYGACRGTVQRVIVPREVLLER